MQHFQNHPNVQFLMEPKSRMLQKFSSRFVFPRHSPSTLPNATVILTTKTIDEFYLLWILSKYILVCSCDLLLCSALALSIFFSHLTS